MVLRILKFETCWRGNEKKMEILRREGYLSDRLFILLLLQSNEERKN